MTCLDVLQGLGAGILIFVVGFLGVSFAIARIDKAWSFFRRPKGSPTFTVPPGVSTVKISAIGGGGGGSKGAALPVEPGETISFTLGKPNECPGGDGGGLITGVRAKKPNLKKKTKAKAKAKPKKKTKGRKS